MADCQHPLSPFLGGLGFHNDICQLICPTVRYNYASTSVEPFRVAGRGQLVALAIDLRLIKKQYIQIA